jgi:hypothetical protein
MMLNKLTFESEGLIVDYVTFNFEQLNESRKADLVNYFYKLGFNSYDTDRKYRNAFDESIKYNSKNLYQIRFRKNITPHWKDTAVAFPMIVELLFRNLRRPTKFNGICLIWVS